MCLPKRRMTPRSSTNSWFCWNLPRRKFDSQKFYGSGSGYELMKEYVNTMVMCSFFRFCDFVFSMSQRSWAGEMEQATRRPAATSVGRARTWVKKPRRVQPPERPRRLLALALSAWLAPPVKKTTTNIILVQGWVRCCVIGVLCWRRVSVFLAATLFWADAVARWAREGLGVVFALIKGSR